LFIEAGAASIFRTDLFLFSRVGVRGQFTFQFSSILSKETLKQGIERENKRFKGVNGNWT